MTEIFNTQTQRHIDRHTRVSQYTPLSLLVLELVIIKLLCSFSEMKSRLTEDS